MHEKIKNPFARFGDWRTDIVKWLVDRWLDGS